jgi:hypothetical protein
MYSTGSAPADLSALIGLLDTFVVAAGWTAEDTGEDYQRTYHRGDCYASIKWDANEQYLALYQSLGYTAASLPHEMDDDSGQGATGSPNSVGTRFIDFNSGGPFINYWFFASDDAPYYIHVVVEIETGVFKHFGFGTIVKIGSWTGGEYAYAHVWSQTSGNPYRPDATAHTFLLDMTTTVAIAATLHVEGLTNQGGTSKWAVFTTSGSAPGTDRDSVARVSVMGSARGGLWLDCLGYIRSSSGILHRPLSPIEVLYDQDTNQVQWLGSMPDVAILNLHAFDPAEEITVGSDTYIVFPWVRKRYTNTVGTSEESWNAGVAYKKIVTP